MLHALLVGIDEYSGDAAPLRGCVADVDAVERMLRQRSAGGSPPRITVLRDGEATWQGVVDAFRGPLGSAGPDDVVLFWYSGHGSQQPSDDPREPDGKDETLLLADSRTPQGRDLVDRELGALVTEAGARGAHVVVVLDCCHSGSGTRELARDVTIRQAPARVDAPAPDPRLTPQPRVARVPGIRSGPGQVDVQPGSGWASPVGRHVLLAACRSDQTAKERDVAGVRRGVFSAALEQVLTSARATLTYRDLVRAAAALVRDWAMQQDPQLEVSVDADARTLALSGALDDRPAHHLVTHEATGWRLDAGAVHGIPSPGPAGAAGATTELDLFPVGSDPAAEQPISRARVVAVGPATSAVELDPPLDETGAYPAVVAVWPATRTTVRVVPPDPDLDGGLAASLDLRPAGPDETADLVLSRAGTAYLVLDESRQALVEAPTAMRALDVAAHMSRWYRVHRLDNPDTRIDLGAVGLDLTVLDAVGERHPAARGEVLMPYTGDQPARFVLEVSNGARGRLFAAVLGLSESYAIDSSPTEGGTVVALDPGARMASFGGQAVTVEIPEDVWRAGHSRRVDEVVVLLCTDAFDLNALTQPALDVSPVRDELVRGADAARGEVLDGLLRSTLTREFGGVTPTADWAVLRFALVAERPLPGGVVGEGRSEIAPGVHVEPHPGLRADVRLSSQGFATRDAVGSIVPPGLGDDPASLASFSFGATRDGEEPVDVLTLTDVRDAGAVTPEHPLVITLDDRPGDDHLLVTGVFDGVHLPVGRLEGNRLTITHLPPEETTRSLGGAIRLLVTRLVRRIFRRDDTVAHLVRVWAARGEVHTDDDPRSIRDHLAGQPGTTVLVLVHGIIGDTRGMAEAFLLPPEDGLRATFGTVLTFDYENLDTPIDETAEILRRMLAGVGLTADTHEVTVVAHSMGGLVSRWMLERLADPGDGTTPAGGLGVQRLVTAGTPAGGSPWPRIEDLALTGITVVLNKVAAGFWPARILSVLVGSFEKVDTALDQMAPGSPLLTALFGDAGPHPRYTAIVGNTSLITKPEPGTFVGRVVDRLQGLLGAAVDLAFLQQANDVAVATTSGAHIPAARSAEIVMVASNHFGYFSSAAGVAALRAALARVEAPTG